MAQFQSGDYVPTTAQRKSSINIVDEITRLAKMDWNDATGRFDPWQFGQDAADARSKIGTISSIVTQPNLDLLKGPMSNTDLEFIKAGSATLDTSQSNKAFEQNIVKLYNISARKAGLTEANSMAEIVELDKKRNQSLQQPAKTSAPAQTGGGTTQEPSRFNELYNNLK